MIAKNEIITLLKTLDSSEWLWLEKFLASPYHNSDERLILLGKLFREAPGFTLKAAKIYPLVFPQQAFVARKWGDLLRKFLQLLRDFMIQQQLRLSPTLTQIAAVENRTQRQLPELTQVEIDAFEAAIQQQPLPLWEEANANRRRWQMQYEVPGRSPAMDDIRKSIAHNRFLYCLLEFRCGIEEQVADIEAYRKDPQQEAALLALAEQLSSRWPVLNLYKNVYLAISENPASPELLHACEQAYYASFSELGAYDKTFFSTKIFAIFNRKKIAKLPGADEDLFRIASFAIAQKIFVGTGQMTEYTFMNFCMIALAVKELEWLQNFRETYLPQLSVTDTTNVELLSKALLEFERGNYGEVYLLSSRASRLPWPQRFQMYGVQIKALTELYLIDPMRYANSLRHFLRAADRFVRYHKQVPSFHRGAFLALIKILRKLMVMRERGERRTTIKAHLETMVGEAKTIIATAWLSEKIAEI